MGDQAMWLLAVVKRRSLERISVLCWRLLLGSWAAKVLDACGCVMIDWKM